jgi:signal transduction histidine kinase/ligand-binding sensor domain-containing protein
MLSRVVMFLLSLPLLTYSFPALDQIYFERLMATQGMTRGTAEILLQDHQGFIWIGTQKGLNRFDGHQFVHFTHDEAKADSLSDNDIKALYEDSEGTLWIGTTDGLNRYNDSQERFTRYKHSYSETNGDYSHHITSIASTHGDELWIGTAETGLFRFTPRIATFTRLEFPSNVFTAREQNHILALTTSKDGILWIGTDGAGLFSFNPNTKEFKHFTASPSTTTSLPSNSVRTIIEGNDGRIWVGTHGGVGRLDRTTGTFDSFTSNPDDPSTIRSPLVEALIEDRDGNIWIGTDGGGLSAWSPESETIHHYRSQTYEQSTIASDVIRGIMEDNVGDLWIAHFPTGISHANRLNTGFRFRRHEPGKEGSLSHDSVKGLAEDSSGNVWVSTDGGGLNYWNRNSDTFTAYEHHPESENSLSAQGVLGIAVDSNDTVWAGTWRGGLNRFNQTSNQFTNFKSEADVPSSLSDSNLFTVIVDSSDTVWAGSLNGLNRFNRLDSTFKRYLPDSDDPSSIGNHEIWTLHEGKDNTLWIGTRKGINRYDRQSDSFVQFPPREGEPGGMKDSWISAIHDDSEGRIWLGTHGAGLQLFDPETNTYRAIEEKHGLADNVVCGILEDDDKQLWISTYNGLSRYNPETEKIRNFRESNGLPDGQFNRFSAQIKLSDGNLMFGSTKGFIWFKPSEIVENTDSPTVLITGLHLFGNRILPNTPGSPLTQSITDTQTLKLKHNQSIIRFDFSAPTFRDPENTSIYFRLEGFEVGWRKAGRDFAAEYTNLDPGTYRLHAYSMNGDGIRSTNEATLELIIVPAFWQTRWCQGLFLGLIGLFIFAVHRTRLNYVERHNQELTQSNDRLREEISFRAETEAKLKTAKERAESSDKAKSLFLANMSHEIRTPLNGIIGVADILQDEKLTNQHREFIDIIEKSGQTLLTLINDILDFSKIEGGELELEEEVFDLVSILEESIELISLTLDEKQLEIVYSLEPEVPRYIESDPIRLRQILSNLIANAVKFTKSGEIRITVNSESISNKQLKLKFIVQDTGIGIPKAGLDRLFHSFSQVDASTTRKYGGTGLGLAISKRLTELLGGTISVESEEGIGSRFHFSILTNRQQKTPLHSQEIYCHQPPLLSKKLLIIDGNSTRQKMLHSATTRWGLSPHLFDSLNETERSEKEIKNRFDVILLDSDSIYKTHSLFSEAIMGSSEQNQILIFRSEALSPSLIPGTASGIRTLRKPLTQEKLLRALTALFPANDK